MQIILKSMSLVNFKGIRQQNFKFSPFVNIISGDNAVGKTTILDAFLWCLFGKDSHDRKDFEIKTLDSTGQVIERIDHEVTLVLEIDGKNLEVKRAFREKWTKKRGSEESEFTGNETEYYWNEVPVKMADFNSRIAGIIDESLFKLLTNVTYFHSLHWEKRREILFGLAGEINELDILDGFTDKDQALIISNILNSDKTIADAKAEYAAKKKRIKDVIKDIPARIDEAERSKPDPVDEKAIKKDIEEKNRKIAAVNSLISDLDNQILDQSKQMEAKNKEYNDRLNSLYELKNAFELRKKEVEATVSSTYIDTSLEINIISSKLTDAKKNLEVLTERKNKGEQTISEVEKKINLTRELWHEENKKVISYDDNAFSCPTCKRALPEQDAHLQKKEMETNFNNRKNNKLEEIKQDGIDLTENLNKYKNAVQEIEADIEAESAKITDLEAEFIDLKKKTIDSKSLEVLTLESVTGDSYLIELSGKIEAAKVALNDVKKEDNTSFISEVSAKKSNFKAEISTIESEINQLKVSLLAKENSGKIDERIKELKVQESTMASELAVIEGVEFAILQYEKARVQLIEDKVNNKFNYVGFRMFETQINGAEIPVCKTLIDGVPFEAANNAARINAGLDIINALSKHNDVYAPIFIDNAESINEIIPVNSQLIRLEVSHDQELVFTTVEELESVTN